jgi:NCS1 family nucleobase:cation symporter-1
VEPLGGVDISWIVGLIVPGVLYYAFGGASRRRAPAALILPGTD